MLAIYIVLPRTDISLRHSRRINLGNDNRLRKPNLGVFPHFKLEPVYAEVLTYIFKPYGDNLPYSVQERRLPIIFSFFKGKLPDDLATPHYPFLGTESYEKMETARRHFHTLHSCAVGVPVKSRHALITRLIRNWSNLWRWCFAFSQFSDVPASHTDNVSMDITAVFDTLLLHASPTSLNTTIYPTPKLLEMLLRLWVNWPQDGPGSTRQSFTLAKTVAALVPNRLTQLISTLDVIPGCVNALLDLISLPSDISLERDPLEALNMALLLLDTSAGRHGRPLVESCLQRGSVKAITSLMRCLATPRLINRIRKLPGHVERFCARYYTQSSFLSCVRYLRQVFLHPHASVWIQQALEGNVLQSFFKATNLYEARSVTIKVAELFEVMLEKIADYTIHRSVLRCVVRSLQRINKLSLEGLMDMNEGLRKSWLNLKAVTRLRVGYKELYYSAPQEICGNFPNVCCPMLHYFHS